MPTVTATTVVCVPVKGELGTLPCCAVTWPEALRRTVFSSGTSDLAAASRCAVVCAAMLACCDVGRGGACAATDRVARRADAASRAARAVRRLITPLYEHCAAELKRVSIGGTAVPPYEAGG